jgi:arylsulfatase A-like enzyme
MLLPPYTFLRNNRPITMRTLFVLLPLLALSLTAPFAIRAEKLNRPPNIIVFLADDLGWSDLRSYGSTFHDTPHLDQLAADGMRFTQAYAASQVCSPTRAALLTGKYPARLATTDWFGAPGPEAPRWRTQNTMLLPAPANDRLPSTELSIARAFKQAGYATFFLGKWHLGGEGSGPTDHGFDLNIGGTAQGGPYGRGRYFHPFDLPNLDSQPGDYLPARLAGEAVKLIRQSGDEPFFMYYSFYSVHTPLMTRPELQEKYEARAKEIQHHGPRFIPEPPRQARQVQDHAVYAGMVEAMDAAVGSIREALQDLDLARNTIILFTSDNGGLSTSEGSPTSNLPLRAGKGWFYEGGLRVPLIVCWPGVTRPASISHTPVITTDVPPTLLEMAGLPPRPEQHLDGKSLTPLLRQAGPIPDRPLFWHYPHYGNQGGSPGSAIRLGPFKLIDFFEGKIELYNLEQDPGETNDLFQSEPLAATLFEQLQQWRKSTGARLPTPNPDYDPARGRQDRQ